jgi:transposase
MEGADHAERYALGRFGRSCAREHRGGVRWCHGEVITRRVNGRRLEVLGVLCELPGPVRAVYEAGPTGYGLVGRARAEGIEMVVCSPGDIERRPGDRIKTDRRDAIRLARLLAAGDLRLVWVPSEEQEQLRDLVGCREDLRADPMRARHRR